MNKWYFNTEIKESSIHGHGRFVVDPVPAGNLVLTIEGNIHKNKNNSFVNHSLNNNLDWDKNKGWISNKDIQPGEELTMNYNQWVDISHLGWDS
jgi:SET domain-containing protein